MSMRRSVGSGVSSSGAAVSKLTAEREMEGFVAGMHANKRLNTVKRNHLLSLRSQSGYAPQFRPIR